MFALAQTLVRELPCDEAGLRADPPVCLKGEAHLPNVYGGPATLGQCVFGHPKPAGGIFGNGQSCWTGALFGFSGVDGQTSVASQYVGWFVNGSYSVYLWLPVARQLHLGFAEPGSVGADDALDRVLIATNDVLLVERPNSNSRLGLTWKDWRTIVGFIEGPAAKVALLEASKSTCKFQGGCCGAEKKYNFSSVTSQHFGWLIESSYGDDAGGTICYIGLKIGGEWVYGNSSKFTVSSPTGYHPNGPTASLLQPNCDTFWNMDTGTGGGPWNLTINLDQEEEVTGFAYAIYKPTEAPRDFQVQAQAGGAWQAVGDWSNASTDGCADGSVHAVNVSVTLHDALALSFAEAPPAPGSTGQERVSFALCYDKGEHSATACARAAAAEFTAGADVEETMAVRNKYIVDTLPALPDASDDRFQRKLLSVMKVNSLSPEGAMPYNWSTTCRAPHKWFFLWDGMMQTIAMNHVQPALGLEYINTYLHFQDEGSGQLCSVLGPPEGRQGGRCSSDAMCPNVAMALWDNYLVQTQGQAQGQTVVAPVDGRAALLDFMRIAFPKLERYLQWDRQHRQGPANDGVEYLLSWNDAGEGGMDHEQNFCPGNAYWDGKCRADHYALDFTNYMVYECQAMARMARVLGLGSRAQYWGALAANITREMDRLMWDETSGLHYDRYFNGSLLKMKTVAAFYPLMIENYSAISPPAVGAKNKVESIVATLQSPDFWTAIPVPTVAVSTPDFSTDLDRGPMWEQQNFYIIRGLRMQGYGELADALRAASLGVVKDYYEEWGVVFEYYDALNTTDPTQTLRKPPHRDVGTCTPGVKGLAGHCGAGGIRDYNFCAGLALLWLRGGE